METDDNITKSMALEGMYISCIGSMLRIDLYWQSRQIMVMSLRVTCIAEIEIAASKIPALKGIFCPASLKSRSPPFKERSVRRFLAT